MAAPTERQQPRLRGSRGGGDAGSLTQRGGPVENTPDWTLRIGPLCGGPSDWLTCPPRGSDLSSELIMEPNSCCCHPINRNHFYSILLVLFWPLLSARLSTDCALCPPPYPNPAVLFEAFRADDQTEPLEHLLFQLRRLTTRKASTSYSNHTPRGEGVAWTALNQK